MNSGQSPEETEAGEPGYGADRRFVDALLGHYFHGNEAASSHRIEAVLKRVDREPGVAVPTVPAVKSFRALRRVAAALLIAGLLLVPTFLSNPASAEIDRAVIAMARPMDQHYRIEIETAVGATLTGEMWCRGSEFVALRLGAVAGDLWAGEGQDSAWVVPPFPLRPVRVATKGTLLEALKLQGDVSTPFLRISTLLESLGDGAEFEFGPDGTTVEARRIDGAPGDLPEWVSVRLAPDGVVRELAAEWSGIFGPRGCRLNWLDDDERSASFYEHPEHHAAGREVIDLR